MWKFLILCDEFWSYHPPLIHTHTFFLSLAWVSESTLVYNWTWLSRFAPFWTDSHEDYAGCHVPLVNSPGATRLHLKLQRFLKPPAPLSPDITLILMWKCQACELVTVWLNPLKLCSTRLSLTSLPPLSSSSVLFCCCEWDCCAVSFLSVCTGTKQRESEKYLKPITGNGVLFKPDTYSHSSLWVTKSTPVWCER